MNDQATRILAIRHGETDWNREGRIQGHLDVALNATGAWQAARLAAALAEETLVAVYASDLCRTLATAQPLAHARGLPVVADRGLRERGFGLFEGLAHAEIARRWPAEHERWRRRDPEFGAPGGETLDGFYARAIAAVERLAARHPGGTIAVVSHGGVMDCLYRAASRVALDAPRTWQLGNTSINRLLYTASGFTLVGWSDASHLDTEAGDDHGDAGPPPRLGRAA
jgi:probable phosphoglycerate mutase